MPITSPTLIGARKSRVQRMAETSLKFSRSRSIFALLPTMVMSFVSSTARMPSVSSPCFSSSSAKPVMSMTRGSSA